MEVDPDGACPPWGFDVIPLDRAGSPGDEIASHILGSRTKWTEALNRKRALTLEEMIRRFSAGFGLRGDVLVQRFALHRAARKWRLCLSSSSAMLGVSGFVPGRNLRVGHRVSQPVEPSCLRRLNRQRPRRN